MGSLSDMSAMTRAAEIVDQQLDLVRRTIREGWRLGSVEVDIAEMSEVTITFNMETRIEPGFFHDKATWPIEVTCIVDPDDERLQLEEDEE